MVALGTRVSRLEKKLAGRSQTGTLEGLSVYQPSEEELAEALAILVECGAVRIINGETTDIARR
jgi:hypothetical protein